MRLTREIRFFAGGEESLGTTNSWAGTSRGCPLGPFWKLSATVAAPVNAQTGYVCNIQLIDDLLRRRVAPRLLVSADEASDLNGRFRNLRRAFDDARTAHAVINIVAMEWSLSPYTRLRIQKEEHTMLSVVHTYEFSAAHRLYCRDLSEDENRRLFGKCANPNGHGHNYVVEVTIAGHAQEQTGLVVDLAFLDRMVRELVIDRFDHKHLNLDCPEFHSLNPSVENIARVIWGLLHDAMAPSRLAAIRVWETPKTCAEYTGSD